MVDYLTGLPRELLLEINIKATTNIIVDPYESENLVFILLNIRGTCKSLREASDCGVAYRACQVEELLNLLASPLEVASFVDLLFIHCIPDILFLMGIRTMFMGDNYFKGLKLVEEAMEVGNTKVTYLFCMLELLNGPHLESHDVDRVLIFLGSLKDNANMMWVRRTTIQ